MDRAGTRRSTSMEDYARHASTSSSAQPGSASAAAQNPSSPFQNPEWHAAAALLKGPVPQGAAPHAHFEFPQRPSHHASGSNYQQSPPAQPGHHPTHQLVHVPRTQTPADQSGHHTAELTEAKGDEELRAIETRRKESHKEVEKRRRENINQGISRLLTLLPPVPFPPPGNPTPQPQSNGQYAASVPPTGTVTSASKQANKAVILESAANYIQHLKDVEQSNIDKWTLEKLLTDQATTELRQERDYLKARMESMELLLSEHGIHYDGQGRQIAALNSFNKRPRMH